MILDLTATNYDNIMSNKITHYSWYFNFLKHKFSN